MKPHRLLLPPRQGWTRRHFLRAFGLATLALGLPTSLAQTRPNGRTHGRTSGRTLARTSRAQAPQTVVVVGAGIAGLLAAQRLTEYGLRPVLLESRERIGGRVLTDTQLAPHPVELGAEFVHGTNVLTWDWLERYDLTTRPDEAEGYGWFADELAPLEAWLDRDWDEAIYAACEALAEAEGDDMSLAEVVGLAGYDAATQALVNNVLAPDLAADLDAHGAYAYLEATYEGDGLESDPADFRINEGYSALIAALAADLDIRTGVQVTRIDGRNFTVETASGERIEADAVVCTLPLGVLQSGAVRFDAPLPAWKQAAIEGLGAGKVNKLVLKFDEPLWEDDLGLLVTALESQMWWRPGYGLPNEAPILTALIGGRSGASYSQLDEGTALERGLADLATMLGLSEAAIAQHLVEGRFVNWGADPHSLMGYSYGPVGAAGLREALAEPLEDWLFFAGEACHVSRPATVHGAAETGIAAADAIAEALGLA